MAIDPGASGGIAYRSTAGTVFAMKMMDTPRDIYDSLKFLAVDKYAHCFLENVGGHRPGNSATASVKFSRHVGHLEMALLALEIPVTKVAPNKWMRTLVPNLPKGKTERKNAIKSKVQERYPHLIVTLATADALGMLAYAIDCERDNGLFFN